MPAIVFIEDEKEEYTADAGQTFIVKNGHLAKSVFEKLAFLAESGNEVEYYRDWFTYSERKDNEKTI